MYVCIYVRTYVDRYLAGRWLLVHACWYVRTRPMCMHFCNHSCDFVAKSKVASVSLQTCGKLTQVSWKATLGTDKQPKLPHKHGETVLNTPMDAGFKVLAAVFLKSLLS